MWKKSMLLLLGLVLLGGCSPTTDLRSDVILTVDEPGIGTGVLYTAHGQYFASLARESASGWKVYTDRTLFTQHTTVGVPILWASAAYERKGELVLVWGGVTNDPEVVKVVAKGQEYDVSENAYLFVWSGVEGEYDFTPAYALDKEGRILYQIIGDGTGFGWSRPHTGDQES